MATHSSILAWEIPGMGEPGCSLCPDLTQTHVHRVGDGQGGLACRPPLRTDPHPASRRQVLPRPAHGIFQARILEWVATSFSRRSSRPRDKSPATQPKSALTSSLLCMGFPRQEYWSGLPLPSPGDLPNPGIEPESPVNSLPLSHWGSP